MENLSQMSLLEVAVKLMEQTQGVKNIRALIKEVLELKGLSDEDGSISTQLYIDITTSSKFVYMGNDEWDLKSRQSLDEFDKDGSAFNTKDDEIDDELDDDLDEDDLDDEDEDDFDDDNEDEDDLDDEDDLNDGEDMERYSEEGFNEDKYNDYMDDYEDMYDEN